MERWASSAAFRKKVRFLMICVAGQGLAATYSKEYRLKNVLNGYIERENDMPRFGQLGCQGFVVFDQAGNMTLPATSPFLDIEERAFGDVEFQLNTLLSGKDVGLLEPGRRVQLTRLVKAKQLNGKAGTVLEFDAKDRRYRVQIDGYQKSHGIQHVNIIPLRQSSQVSKKRKATGCGPGGCSMPKPSQCSMDDGKCSSSGGCSKTEASSRTITCPSVGVKAMDDEHEECFSALKQLQGSRKLDALEKAKETIAAHFAHEEKLFKETGFDDGGKFSKTKSHCQDHRKILAEIDAEMNRCSNSGGSTVSEDFISSLAFRLSDHTKQYDTQYSSHMQKHFKQ